MSGSPFEVFMAPSAHKRFKKFNGALQNKVKEEARKLSLISAEELIEFLADTEPDWYRGSSDQMVIRALEVHEVPCYA